jgi:hypothetical protein
MSNVRRHYMSLELPPTSNRSKLLAGQVIGGAVGIAAGTYSGINLVLPAAAAAAIWYVGKKLVSPSDPKYLAAIAIQGAHLAWLLFGMLLLGAWGANLLDVVVLCLGLVWLWFRPSIWPVVLLSVFQIAALALNTSLILEQPIGSPAHRSLIVHIGLRILAIAAMWRAFLQSRRQRGDA